MMQMHVRYISHVRQSKNRHLGEKDMEYGPCGVPKVRLRYTGTAVFESGGIPARLDFCLFEFDWFK